MSLQILGQVREAMRYHDKDEFVKIVNEFPVEDKLAKQILHVMFVGDQGSCLSAVLAGETNGKLDVNAYCSQLGFTPLHRAAIEGSFKITRVLLDHGQDPNVRVDWPLLNFKQALPLNLALAILGLSNYLDDWNYSPFRLICKLCTYKMRNYLETVRLLALQTKELDQEIANYVKEGKVIELCAIMLLGYKPQPTSIYQFVGDESTEEVMRQLLQIFQQIGDKLQAYLMIERSTQFMVKPGKVVTEIGTLFEDAGFAVESKNTLMYNDLFSFEGEKNEAVPFYVRRGQPYAVLRDMQLAWGLRCYHSSSILNTCKESPFPSELRSCMVQKPPFYRHPLFARVLRMVTRRA